MLFTNNDTPHRNNKQLQVSHKKIMRTIHREIVNIYVHFPYLQGGCIGLNIKKFITEAGNDKSGRYES